MTAEVSAPKPRALDPYVPPSTVSMLLAQASAASLPLRDESVQCVVTSPPYWGLRAYAGEQEFAWGGDPGHAHEWGAMQRGRRADLLPADETTSAGRIGTDDRQDAAGLSGGRFCACGAWYGGLGLEPTPDLYVEHIVEVFREVRRVLRSDGVLWLNLGDSHAAKARGSDKGWDKSRLTNPGTVQKAQAAALRPLGERHRGKSAGLKNKDLVGIPWMVAFALRADGWYLRSDIIWAKPNPMPESITDRPTKSHEHLFLLAKSERYFYDAAAIKEPLSPTSVARLTQPTFDRQEGGEKDYANGTNPNRSARRTLENLRDRVVRDPVEDHEYQHDADTRFGKRSPNRVWSDPDAMARMVEVGRNKRDVWTIPTRPYAGAHFATYPEALVEPCIKAGSRPGDVVLDPFNGSGTTGRVAVRLGRSYVGLDLAREYLADLSSTRLSDVQMELVS